MNESLINHLFRPHHLPSSADDDFLIKNNHENEYKLLDFFLNSLQLPNMIDILPIFQVLMDCILRWSKLQNLQYFSVSNIQFTLQQLSSGEFLPLYFHAQNAAILIEIDGNNKDQALISAWQVLLPNEVITSSLQPHQSCFPVTTYRLFDRSRLASQVHCELLIDFMHNTVEYSKSYKSSREVDEIRDVPESHYVCQWWIQHFDEIKVEPDSRTSVQFTKKHRDHIRWNNALLPFRRSGLWMVIKAVVHTILTKRLKDIGTIVYKLLITRFLTEIISTRSTTIDLLIHCTRKIVRRLSKIERLLSPVRSNDMSEWIAYTKQYIEVKIDEMISKSMCQYSITHNENLQQNLLADNFTLDNGNIYELSCIKLKAYMNNNKYFSNKVSAFNPIDYNNHTPTNISQKDGIPSLNILRKQMGYTVGISLIRMEIWVESDLEQWINLPSPCVNEKNRFELLLNFFEEYQTEALNHYWSEKGSTDPMGYSRFLLTSLTLIRCMHRKLCQDKRFERLKQHSIDIPHLLKLFEFLVLPNRNDIIRANDLYQFFDDYNNKLYPDLLNDIKSKNAFGVNFAKHSAAMADSIECIRTQAEQDEQNKIQEVSYATERYKQLMNVADNSPCEYMNERHKKQCERCEALKQANKIQVKVFECPIPSVLESALAVIFELQMQIEIRCYREILWQFVNRPTPHPQHQMYEWLNVPPHDRKLRPFYTGPNQCYVRLVSPTKSITQTHYSTPPSLASMSVDDFIFENSLKVQISQTQPIDLEDECSILTPQLDHPNYKQLQFAINTTQFAQNEVIAKLSDCSSQFQAKHFIEFGSFRSGHRLQWWNLLTIFEMNSLSIAEESVAILITHSISQNGPFTSEFESSWCPESHQPLLEDHFIDQFLSKLNQYLDHCELNWQNELVLVVITMITMRLLTICNSTRIEQITNLALKCRQIGEQWIDLMSISIGTISPSSLDEIEKVRVKIINVGIGCILTFAVDQDRINSLFSSNEDVLSLLKAASTIHDNIILNKNQFHISPFMKNLMRYSERVLVMIQPTVAEYLRKTSYQSLNDFTLIYWIAAKRKGNIKGKWSKRREDPYDGWYDCQYQSNSFSIDCIKGTFLINGMTIGFLPENIISNELFIRLFGDHMFEVQVGNCSNSYTTKHSYHGTGLVHYEFDLNSQTNDLIIREQHIQTNEIFQLIPHHCFENELADRFITNYSHWWNEKDQIIEFRPIHFKQIDFLNSKFYNLSMQTGYLTTIDTTHTQTLINQSSIFFQNLFNQYFNRLDEKSYVYMMGNPICHRDTTIDIHLSRLGIAFRYNPTMNIITSREYSNMCIDKHEWLGTMIGLKSGLLLSPLSTNNHQIEQYPYRKFVVPFGKVHCERSSTNTDHQTVTIDRSSSMSFLDQYFVFILNDHLKIVQSTDSPTGWLYLSLLHAMTSYSLPDQYTQMTGMERAFQLLKSAASSSDQPYDLLSLEILSQIASISPKANYYPENFISMEKLDWNSNGLPYSMQHFGYYLLVKQLIETSQQLSFMYSTSTKIPKIFSKKFSNESLLQKLYWNYRDSYNPLTRLPLEMEEKILLKFKTESYQITPKYSPYPTNSKPPHPVLQFYKNGNVNLKDSSEHHWLPLSQWTKTEYQLRDIWIGLFKMIHQIKSSPKHTVKDQIEQFEKLIDFLHYIIDKLNSTSFYLEILKTILNVKKISLTSISFPPFIEYRFIDEISVRRNRIHFSKHLTLNAQDTIVAEVEDCLSKNKKYEDQNGLATVSERTQINHLLISWKNNQILRSFLQSIEDLIHSVQMKRYPLKVTYIPQKYTLESFENHYEIKLKTRDKSIDQNVLRKAQQRFLHRHSGHFNKPFKSIETQTKQNEFPSEIFSLPKTKDKKI